MINFLITIMLDFNDSRTYNWAKLISCWTPLPWPSLRPVTFFYLGIILLCPVQSRSYVRKGLWIQILVRLGDLVSTTISSYIASLPARKSSSLLLLQQWHLKQVSLLLLLPWPNVEVPAPKEYAFLFFKIHSLLSQTGLSFYLSCSTWYFRSFLSSKSLDVWLLALLGVPLQNRILCLKHLGSCSPQATNNITWILVASLVSRTTRHIRSRTLTNSSVMMLGALGHFMGG